MLRNGFSCKFNMSINFGFEKLPNSFAVVVKGLNILEELNN